MTNEHAIADTLIRHLEANGLEVSITRTPERVEATAVDAGGHKYHVAATPADLYRAACELASLCGFELEDG